MRTRRARSGKELRPIKAQLRALIRLRKVPLRALAREIGWYHPQLRRALAPAHNSRIDQLATVAAALGHKIQVTLVERKHGRSSRRA